MSPTTAVITGASKGIGQVFAEQLASRGHSLVLIARDHDRLERLGHQIRSNHDVQVTVRPTDLSEPCATRALADELGTRSDIELLVNNAGFGTMGDFVDVGTATHDDMIEVHMSATVKLTHAVLPKMIDRGRGAIINVASMSAFLIGPGQTMYAASKVFLKSFSESLFGEVRDKGVYVQALCPGFTRTAFHDTDEFSQFDRETVPSRLWMTPQDVVRESLDAMDRGRTPICIPSMKNRWLAKALRLDVVRRIAGRSVRKDAS